MDDDDADADKDEEDEEEEERHQSSGIRGEGLDGQVRLSWLGSLGFLL